ncbi:MAG: ABC transporter permease [Candidatus Gastranaerophilales bacterium]|nr:ABC transporter permease [Candidatus Gastranaerophilales bacterium]
MKNLWRIFQSEFKNMMTDKGSMLVMVLGIFMYSLFYTIPFSTHILREVPLGVVDFDNSSFSREFIRNLDSNEFIKVTSEPIDIDAAKEEYYRDKIKSFIVIPKGFEKDILRGGHSFITSYEDSAFLIIYKQVATGIITTATSFGAKIEIGSLMKKGLSKQQAISMKLPFEFVDMPLYNPVSSYQNYLYPIVLILILQQTMLIGAGILGGTLKERLKGCKEWSKDGAVEVKSDKVNEFSDNPIEIVFGKSLAYTSIYTVYTLIYFLIPPAFLVYDMSYNIIPMILLFLPFLFATAFLGQLLVFFYTGRESSLMALVVTSVPLIFLPGFVWPTESIPFGLLVFSKFMPATPAINGLIKINQMGASFWQVQGDFWLLVGLCVLYFFLACLVVKRMQKKVK